MKMLAAVASVVMLYGAVVTQSKADAIYKWHGDPASPNPSAMSLTLVISDDAVKAGHVDFTYYGTSPVNLRASSTDVQELWLSWSDGGFGASFGFNYEFQQSGPIVIGVHLNLLPSGYAAGGIGLGEGYTDLSVVLVSNASGLFTTQQIADGDWALNPSNCGPNSEYGCPPLPTGTIQKVGHVPEPGSLALMGLGLIGFRRFTRRRALVTPR
ncbi:PEP-CTERM sorting domain-containing protein [Massilia sp. LXY-6]|uniref:PEP-CTERM sorting domain-containing protein n=1 Tax=Massilia sp. LXY-6 TaxID=3379823 RepID=UPI003EE29D02